MPKLDSNTNFVYISKLLKSDYSDFYDELARLFDEISIAWGALKDTKDILVRDFMYI